MYHKKNRVSVIGLILIVTLTACEKQPTGPKIEWLSPVMTYSYSGGVLSGVNFYCKFNVIDDQPGELSIEASVGSTRKSCSAFVEAGEQYKVLASCGLGTEGSKSTLILDPSSESEPLEIPITGYSVNLKGVEIKE